MQHSFRQTGGKKNFFSSRNVFTERVDVDKIIFYVWRRQSQNVPPHFQFIPHHAALLKNSVAGSQLQTLHASVVPSYSPNSLPWLINFAQRGPIGPLLPHDPHSRSSRLSLPGLPHSLAQSLICYEQLSCTSQNLHSEDTACVTCIWPSVGTQKYLLNK